MRSRVRLRRASNRTAQCSRLVGYPEIMMSRSFRVHAWHIVTFRSRNETFTEANGFRNNRTIPRGTYLTYLHTNRSIANQPPGKYEC